MVKINTICRSDYNYQRETKFDINKVIRTTDPSFHPFQRSREYQRALLTTKMDKIFAKPFVGCLVGHSDSISVMAKCPNNLVKIVSGSFDGEIKAWDISNRSNLFSINAHQNQIKGLTFSLDGYRVLSSGNDKIINLYDYAKIIENKKNASEIEPMSKYLSKVPLNNLDHSWNQDQFATAGQIVQVWSYERTKPITQFEWGADSIIKVKYNPSEHNLMAGTGIDCSIVIYDIRGETPLNKIFLPNKCHCLCWNPAEPINLTVGCDDGNSYTFDMRKMEQIKFIYKDHIGGIMDLDIAPTGKEFVTGSYDKTIRIFDFAEGKSREVYHGKRMQQIFSVLWSMDNEYILSGSDDMNIRIWKSQPSKPIGTISKRQENSLNYMNALKDKFKYNKEIRRIQKHRHLPKYILNAKKKKQIQKESKFNKNKNAELNNPGQWHKPKPERESKVIKNNE